MKISTCLSVSLLILSACSTTRMIDYEVISRPNLAEIEINGEQKCSTTPCRISVPCYLNWVGIVRPPDGWEGKNQHVINAFPLKLKTDQDVFLDDGNSRLLNSQSQTLTPCDDRNKNPDERKIEFNLSQKAGYYPSKGDNKQIRNVIRYFGASSSNHRFYSKYRQTDNKEEFFYVKSYSLHMGSEIVYRHGLIILQDLALSYGDQTRPAQRGQKILDSAYTFQIYWSEIQVFHMTTGLSYARVQDTFRDDIYGAYLGGGITFNHRSFTEIFAPLGMARWSYYDYRMPSRGYDFFVDAGAVFPFVSPKREYQKVFAGLRIYI